MAFSSLLRFRKHTTQLRKYYPGSRGPFPKYLIWNKPCLRFDKAPETLFFSLGASPRTISSDKKKYPLELKVVKYLPVHEFIHTSSLTYFFCCERGDFLCSHSNGDIFTCENNMLFSRVKISCFRAKVYLVFHWCLYNKMFSLDNF